MVLCSTLRGIVYNISFYNRYCYGFYSYANQLKNVEHSPNNYAQRNRYIAANHIVIFRHEIVVKRCLQFYFVDTSIVWLYFYRQGIVAFQCEDLLVAAQ